MQLDQTTLGTCNLPRTPAVLEDVFGPVELSGPGPTDTRACAAMPAVTRSAMLAAAVDRLPARRVAQPQDVAAGYLYLIENPCVTGTVIDIDGAALTA